jgi:hypothetical protein
MLGVSERMVRYYLKPKAKMQHLPKHSLLDPYQEYIRSKIEETPNYNLVVLRKELRGQGYTGGMTILRVYAKQVRDEIVKRAVIRFETMPAQQVQVDWKEAGVWEIEGVPRKVFAPCVRPVYVGHEKRDLACLPYRGVQVLEHPLFTPFVPESAPDVRSSEEVVVSLEGTDAEPPETQTHMAEKTACFAHR